MGINNVLELYRAVLAAEAFERVEAAYSALFKKKHSLFHKTWRPLEWANTDDESRRFSEYSKLGALHPSPVMPVLPMCRGELMFIAKARVRKATEGLWEVLAT